MFSNKHFYFSINSVVPAVKIFAFYDHTLFVHVLWLESAQICGRTWDIGMRRITLGML
jgi:hypothetical protein